MTLLRLKNTDRISLTASYLCGLSLIIMVMSMTLVLFLKHLSIYENDAFIINVSGKQRMLSQRIALMANQSYIAQSAAEANTHALNMANAIEEMLVNHSGLSYGAFDNGVSYVLSPEIRNIYYSKNGLDEKVRSYIKLAEQFLSNYIHNNLSSEAEKSLIEQISHYASDDLVNSLDHAVSIYEQESKQKLENFRSLTITFFILGLMIIGFEIIIIFNPMVNKIHKNQQELADRNKELTEFAYRISHDLRAPIVSAIGLSSNALEAMKTCDLKQAENSILHLKNGLSNLEQLTEDVIELTKMKIKKILEEFIHLDYLVDLAVRSVENIPNFSNVKIQTHIDVHEPIGLKRLLLQQVLENLISNAIKYSDPDKELSYIKISASLNNKKLHISIRDNGIGIPKDYQEKIFTMFQRFHPKISYGSGLGLYLVKQNVTALNGHIYYYGLADGTEFKITIPISKQKEDADEDSTHR